MGDLILIAGRDPMLETGGAESYSLGHARAAHLAGLSVHMFTLGPASATVAHDWGVLHRVATPLRPVLPTYAPLHRRWLVPAVVKFVAARPGPHVLQGYGGWSDLAADARSRLRRRGIPATAVATFFTTAEHGESAKFRGARGTASARLQLVRGAELLWAKTISARSERRGYLGCDLVTVNYESVRTLLERTYGPRPGIHRLAYAAETAFLSPRAAGPDGRAGPDGSDGHTGPEGSDGRAVPMILAVSRHSARKGLDVLIRALAALRDDGVSFQACLVGEGTLLSTHRRLVSSLGLGDLVSLPGRVPDVVPYLHECDVFVLPSTEEGSGSVSVLEALQTGSAIVSTNVDGMPEDLTHEVDAILVSPGDPAELRDAMRRLLSEPDYRRELGARGRALYQRRFSPAVAARSLAAFYAPLGLGVTT
jgi:glycosyltransferase involved in cell wall biosynthesis